MDEQYSVSPRSPSPRTALSSMQGRSYKSRKTPPCDACRRRRTGCIRKQGNADCVLCEQRSIHCTFNSAPRPKARRTSSSAIKMNEDSTVNVPQVLNLPAAEISGHGADMPLALSPEKEKSFRWATMFVGLSGDHDPFVLRHCSFDQSNFYKQPDWACLRLTAEGVDPVYFTVVPDSHLDARPDYYPVVDVEGIVSPNGSRLMRAYFEFVHTSFPLLDTESVSKQGVSGNLLLAVMYVLAAPFCKDIASITRAELHSYVFRAINLEMRHANLETVEAAILWLQRHTMIHRAPTAPGLFAEIGSIVGIAHELGLNVNPSMWNITDAHRNRRIRLWWAVFIFDKWTALGMGRPSYLNDENSTVPLISLHNFPVESYDGNSTLGVAARQFVAIATISVILSDIMSTFYTLQSADRLRGLHPKHIFGLFQEFRLRLDNFKRQCLDDLLENQAFPDPTGNVAVAYHTLEIVLCRACLRDITPGNMEFVSIRLYAKDALRAMVTLLEKLGIRQIRAFWWSPISRVNFSMAGSFMFSLLLSSVDDEEVDYWTSQIAHFRRLLDMHSLGFDTTVLAATRMELLSNVNKGPEVIISCELVPRPAEPPEIFGF